ncbi:hypothetical protein M427DRAFT_57069, partial [Gonapodya prolifera JEL478]
MGTTIAATDAPDYWDSPSILPKPIEYVMVSEVFTPLEYRSPREIIAAFAYAATCTSCKRAYVLAVSFLCQGPDNLAQFHAQGLNVICLLVSTPIMEIYLNDFALGVKQAQEALESRNREECREAMNAASTYAMAPLNSLFIVKPVALGKVLARKKAYWNALLELY